MVKVHFVFTDSRENFLISRKDLESACSDDVVITSEYHSNNSLGLPEVFNGVLDSIRSSNEAPDHVAFVHGDVSFDVRMFVDRLVALEGKYDLVGLAGAKRMNTSHSPLNWFTSSHEFQDSRFGDITMNRDNAKPIRCFYNQFTHPEIKDTPVACIDGLCMVMNRRMLESDIRFITGIKFNCYDTYISLESILKYKFKVGVMVMPTIHQSVGMSIMSSVFAEEEKVLRDHFGL